MYKLIFYIPVDDVGPVKEALFAIGAGTLGKYAKCSWQTLGEGQFLPLENSNPTIGEIGRVEEVAELRVEILCSKKIIKTAITTLIDKHPYEEVAYEVYPVLDISSFQ